MSHWTMLIKRFLFSLRKINTCIIITTNNSSCCIFIEIFFTLSLFPLWIDYNGDYEHSSRSPPSIRHPPGAFHNSAATSRVLIRTEYRNGFFMCFIISLISSSLLLPPHLNLQQNYLLQIIATMTTNIMRSWRMLSMMMMSRWNLITK